MPRPLCIVDAVAFVIQHIVERKRHVAFGRHEFEMVTNTKFVFDINDSHFGIRTPTERKFR
mgnify:CR=1 FL=1